MIFRDAVAQYLSPLYQAPPAQAEVWFGADGCAQARFFSARMGSRFQSIACLHSGRVIGHEAQVRNSEESASDLNIWKLLDHAASDQESIVLDRLCRLLHALNYYHQSGPSAGELYLSVHARLLAAVSENHGAAFRKFLNALDLPHEKIVLQLPLVTSDQGWELNFVADNYRRNGFRIAVKAADAQQALNLLERVQPDVIKVDAATLVDETVTRQLLSETNTRGARLIFTRTQAAEVRNNLAHLAAVATAPLYVQGLAWDVTPAESLRLTDIGGGATEHMQWLGDRGRESI